MDSKLLVFVVLMSLGHGAFARRSTPFDGLSEEDLAVLSKLRANHAAASSIKANVKIQLFAFVEKFVAGRIFDLEPRTSYDDEAAAVIAEIKRIDKRSFDLMLNAISIGLKNRCDELEKTRTAIYADLDNVYSGVLQQLKLALSGKYIENDKSSVLALIEGLSSKFFNLMRSCQKVTDADTLALIKTAENRSLTGLYYATTPLLNFLKRYVIAIASGNKSQTLIDEVKASLSSILAGARLELDSQIAILETLYIISVSNCPGIGPALFLNQYAEIVRIYNFEETANMILDDDLRDINRINLQLLDESEEVFSQTDLAEEKTAALYADGTNVLMKLVSYLRPHYRGEIEDSRIVLIAQTDKLNANFFLMKKSALDKNNNYSKSVAKIRILEKEQDQLSRKITEILRGLISGDEDSSDETKNESGITEKRIELAFEIYIRSLRDGATLVANAARGNGPPSRAYISEIQALKRQVKSAVRNYVEGFSELFYLSHLNSNKC